MITNFSIIEADRKPNALRQACAEISSDHPDDITIGYMLFGQFAQVEVIHGHPLIARNVSATNLGGYWKAGKSQLFTASELSLAEKDEE